MTIKELNEKRAAIIEEMRTITTTASLREDKDLTEEEAKQLNERQATLKRLDTQLSVAHTLEARDAELAQNKVGARKDEDKATAEMRAFTSYLREGRITEEVRAALTTDNASVMIPKEISQKIILGIQGQFDLLNSVDLRVTPHAKTFFEPILSGNMSLKRITVGAENEDGSPAIDGVEIKAYDYRLPVIPISLTLLEGSDADIQGAIVALLTEHIARGLASLALTSGTASDGISALVPKVLVTPAASATAITYGDLVDVLAKVKAPHNAQGRASWLMNSATRAALMKVLDDNGRPIFLQSAREGEPDRILGRPVVIDDNMPNIAANAVPIVFGDLKKYVLRIVQGVRIRVYQEEKFYKDNCIGVQAFVTGDGKLIAKTGSYEPLAGLKMKAS